jgi:N-acetylmuramic acid 6-phosphate etherase
MTDWSRLATEQRNPASESIDEISTLEMLQIISDEDAQVVPALQRVLPSVADAVDAVTEALARRGRLVYVGAGTSGRLGILDAAECPPTFGTDPDVVRGVIAGGSEAVFRSVEGAEDDRNAADDALLQLNLSPPDILVGIAASGVTPFVLEGLAFARTRKCATILFSCSPDAAASVDADIKVLPRVGPEVITGSTRMKAGTATKLFLNMLSTAAMVKLGKTFGNLMVDLKPWNAKLKDRSVRILSSLAKVEVAQAERTLECSGGDLKTALVMQLCNVDVIQARDLLAESMGKVKAVVQRQDRLED